MMKLFSKTSSKRLFTTFFFAHQLFHITKNEAAGPSKREANAYPAYTPNDVCGILSIGTSIL